MNIHGEVSYDDLHENHRSARRDELGVLAGLVQARQRPGPGAPRRLPFRADHPGLLDFAEVEALQAAGDWDVAGELLAGHAASLEAAGAELIVLCTNTMHIVADRIIEAISVPFLHIGDATAGAITTAGLSTVGLLGTAFTMEQPFLRDRLAQQGVTAIVPNPTDRQIVHRIIYDELVQGIITEESRQAFREVIGRLVAAGADGIILGCTEIELVVRESDSPVPLFPTTRIQVRAAVDAALG